MSLQQEALCLQYNMLRFVLQQCHDRLDRQTHPIWQLWDLSVQRVCHCLCHLNQTAAPACCCNFQLWHSRRLRVSSAWSTYCLQEFVRRKHKNIPIEVETRTLDEVQEVLQFLETDKHSLVKRLMLDNMTKLDPSAPGTFWGMHSDLPAAAILCKMSCVL